MKTKKLLWLDDIRNPFLADWLMQYVPEFDEDRENVVWVKNYNEFIDWITENGLPHKIAFDHDLGEDVAISLVESGMNKKKARMVKRESKSGFDAAKFVMNFCLDNDLPVPEIVSQSANPTGRENILKLLSNLVKHRGY